MAEYYEHIELKTWNDFKILAEESRLEWIFRGQSNSEWELQTTLERSNIVENFPEFEDELLKDFKKGVRFYLNEEQLPNSMLEYFSLLQHFGAPSRLLDFTKSPYVAAYFAFEQASETGGKIAIWVVDKNALYQSAVYYFKDNKIKFSSESSRYAFDDQTFENVFHESKQGELNCIFPIEPFNQNRRYHLQQSIFLSQGNPYKPLLSQLDFIKDEILKKTFMKVTIPSAEKKTAIRDLIKMNINRATLFPGLDGFAKSLLLKYGNLSSLGETYEFLKYAKSKNMV